MADDFLEVVYDDIAQEQFDYLVNLDFGYIYEPAIYEKLLSSVPELVSLEMGYEGKKYYLFSTRQRYLGPPPLWISFTIEREKHRVRIFDIRQHPTKRK